MDTRDWLSARSTSPQRPCGVPRPVTRRDRSDPVVAVHEIREQHPLDELLGAHTSERKLVERTHSPTQCPAIQPHGAGEDAVPHPACCAGRHRHDVQPRLVHPTLVVPVARRHGSLTPENLRQRRALDTEARSGCGRYDPTRPIQPEVRELSRGRVAPRPRCSVGADQREPRFQARSRHAERGCANAARRVGRAVRSVIAPLHHEGRRAERGQRLFSEVLSNLRLDTRQRRGAQRDARQRLWRALERPKHLLCIAPRELSRGLGRIDVDRGADAA